MRFSLIFNLLNWLLSFTMWSAIQIKLFSVNLAHLSSQAQEIGNLAGVLALGSAFSLVILSIIALAKDAFKPALKIVYPIFGGLICSYIGFGLLIYAKQDDLLFSPRTISASRLDLIKIEYPEAKELWVETDDHKTLQGWLVESTSSKAAPLVIFFAGQGGEASRYLKLAKRIPGYRSVFINYRGYGLSEGIPSDTALFNDSLALYDHLKEKGYLFGNDVAVLGGSLGTGVATYLAANRDVAGVILFSPYDRIAGGVTRDMLPFLPTSLIFKNKFDMRLSAAGIKAPGLFIIGEDDKVISPKRSFALLEIFSGKTEIEILKGDHYSIYEDPIAWKRINRFLADIF